MSNRLSFSKIIKIASWWKSAGGSSKVEVAALEPLLWKDGNYKIHDIISMLKDMGFIVTMTTNGSTLSKHANYLKKAGLDLLRVSCHSLDPEIFRKITGGGNLELVQSGILAAIAAGLKIKINRVLLKGHTHDLGEHINFINHHQITLKILDLYWTPSSANMYNLYYISPKEAISPFINECHLMQSNIDISAGRHRKIYKTPNSGMVEFKIKESAEKPSVPCQSCKFNTECLEGYGDYFRVFPNGDASLCYLRSDLSTQDYNSISISERAIPLRLVLEGRCNFNCGFPTEEISWCLKQGRGFNFPNRSGVIKIENKF